MINVGIDAEEWLGWVGDMTQVAHLWLMAVAGASFLYAQGGMEGKAQLNHHQLVTRACGAKEGYKSEDAARYKGGVGNVYLTQAIAIGALAKRWKRMWVRACPACVGKAGGREYIPQAIAVRMLLRACAACGIGRKTGPR
ncbi:hypothetical protein BDV95DRAFT_177779 [Massariosphaeria phaeospora]|uniref:Uncharacterized protein n=1 Tax=Massariosphaeria phaeospora TaxID=100035 RepID=A0A7C8M1S0_9PLEO|nr:hypothetical protein BDV95DRAFT_177779 [Massariosphaeria phaeospora]